MLFQDLSIYRRISSKTSVKYLIEEKISFYSGSYECSFIKSRYIITFVQVLKKIRVILFLALP